MSGDGQSAMEQQILDSIQESEVVSLLQALIQQRSDSPPGDCLAAVGLPVMVFRSSSLAPAIPPSGMQRMSM